MKTDGFGLEHHKACKYPAWSITESARGGGAVPVTVQRCKGCGLIWRHGDPAGPAQAHTGFTEGRR